jgi:hypothetical protein
VIRLRGRLKRDLKVIKIAFKVTGGLRWHWKRDIFVVNIIYEKVSVLRAVRVRLLLLPAASPGERSGGE